MHLSAVVVRSNTARNIHLSLAQPVRMASNARTFSVAALLRLVEMGALAGLANRAHQHLADSIPKTSIPHSISTAVAGSWCPWLTWRTF